MPCFAVPITRKGCAHGNRWPAANSSMPNSPTGDCWLKYSPRTRITPRRKPRTRRQRYRPASPRVSRNRPDPGQPASEVGGYPREPLATIKAERRRQRAGGAKDAQGAIALALGQIVEHVVGTHGKPHVVGEQRVGDCNIDQHFRAEIGHFAEGDPKSAGEGTRG